MKYVQLLASVTLVLLPVYLIRCKSFAWCRSPVPLTLLEVLILATFVAWIFWKVSQVRKGTTSGQSVFRGLTGPLFWPLVTFLIFATVSVFIAPDLRMAAGIWKAYFIEPAILFIVVADLTTFKKSLTWAVLPILFSGLWVSLLAIWQAATGTNQFAPYAIAQGRVSSIYSTPNAIGLYVGPLALLALGCLVELYRRKKISLKKFGLPLYLALCIATFILAIYLSKSRGAILGISVSLLVFAISALYLNLPNFFRRLLQLGFLFAVFVYLLLNIVVFVKIDNFVAAYKPAQQDSIEARFCMWQATRNLLADRPITGAGLAAYQETYPSYATCYEEAQLYPHNIFLNFWTEIGFFGMVAFLWICFVSFKILERSFKNFIPVGLFSALVYIFAHGLVDVPYFKNDLAVEFWLLLALISYISLQSKINSRLLY